MRKLFAQFDFALALEIIGLALVTYGISTYSLPLACIALGSFIVWATEKGA